MDKAFGVHEEPESVREEAPDKFVGVLWTYRNKYNSYYGSPLVFYRRDLVEQKRLELERRDLDETI